MNRHPLGGPLLLYSATLVPLAMAVAELARTSADSSAQAADNGLSWLLGGVLPLTLALALLDFEASPGGPAVVLGANRRRLVLDLWWRLTACTSALTALVVTGLLVWTRTAGDQQLLTDLSVTAPITCGATAATFAVFGAARAWGGKLGLALALVLSWTLGQSDVPLSALLPGGHIRHLIGVGEPLPISTSLSATALGAFVLVMTGILLARVPR